MSCPIELERVSNPTCFFFGGLSMFLFIWS